MKIYKSVKITIKIRQEEILTVEKFLTLILIEENVYCYYYGAERAMNERFRL